MTQYYGQHEPPVDQIIEELLPLGFGPGVFVDVGAGCGTSDNNSYYFEQRGWRCICVEPSPMYAEVLTLARKAVALVALSDHEAISDFHVFGVFDRMDYGAISGLKTDARLLEEFTRQGYLRRKWTVKVPVTTLDHLAHSYRLKDIHVLSIDTEGTEIEVLNGFSIANWLPKVVVVENNYDDPWTVDWMKASGYKRVRRNVVNDFYVRE